MTIPTTLACYNWTWILTRANEFSFKQIYDRYGFCKYDVGFAITYPRIKFSNEFKYCGYTTKAPLSANHYFEMYSRNPKVEMLAKLGRWDFLSFFYRRQNQLETYMNPIRTVIKNNYTVKDIGIWIDYLECLKFFKKDLSSPRWVCPEDLHKAHDKWTQLKKEHIDEEDAKKYSLRVKKYIGINLGKDNIEITAISNLEQMRHEAKLLNLCYISNKYYNKENSLILSAKVNGVPTEGIEVDLKTREVIQVRGKNNNPSLYHKQIKALVDKNLKKLFKLKEEEIEHSKPNRKINKTARAGKRELRIGQSMQTVC